MKSLVENKTLTPLPQTVNIPNVTASQHISLSIVIPTFNERDNIEPLLTALDLALPQLHFETIFVDDNSPDGTSDHIREIAKHRCNLRVIQRIHERGLASACVEGVRAANAELVLIMDADLQHDESIIPQLLHAVQNQHFDVASGTRFGGGNNSQVAGLPLHRRLLSYAANFLAKTISGQKLKDPMSGFFLFKRQQFLDALPKMACSGYKIFFDYLCASKTKLNVQEIKFHFRERQAGESKLDLKVLWEYALLLISKLTLGLLPIRFIGFCLVGLSGVAIHFTLMLILFKTISLTFITSQSIATLAAMTWNYQWNNTLTYAHQKQSGKNYIHGLITFIAISATGALASILISETLYQKHIPWPLAVIAGITYTSLWNYALTKWLVWKSKP